MVDAIILPTCYKEFVVDPSVILQCLGCASSQQKMSRELGWRTLGSQW